MKVEFERPNWLMRYESVLTSEVKFYLAKRVASSGRPTFALYYTPLHKHSEGFPIPLGDLIDVPVWVIRDFFKKALIGKRIMEKLNKWTLGYPDEILEAWRIGYEIEESKNMVELCGIEIP